jgi:hypothetical protein
MARMWSAVGNGVPLQAGGVLPPSAGRAAVGGAINFRDRGGPVIQTARLILIFWGTSWAGSPPVTVESIVKAATKIVTGGYMNRLQQYRNIHRATVQARSIVATSFGSSPADPPSPFSDADVQTLISNLIIAGSIPGPATDTQLLYMVFMPPNVASSSPFTGEHWAFEFRGTQCHCGWVTNDGTLNDVTSTFSHELVESVTDPEGDAITGDPGSCRQDGWCEIGDVCAGNNVTIDGVNVQRYWSQVDGKCVPD